MEDTEVETYLVIGLSVLVLVAGVAALWKLSKMKSRWGVSFSPMTCPRCKTVAPRARMPASLNELMWGGSTCSACGCKMDKYAQELAKP